LAGGGLGGLKVGQQKFDPEGFDLFNARIKLREFFNDNLV